MERPLRLTVRTSDSHSENRSSILLEATRWKVGVGRKANSSLWELFLYSRVGQRGAGGFCWWLEANRVDGKRSFF